MEGTVNRKKEVIEICLQTFIVNGLSGTTSRDLSNAMQLQSGGMYYYFESKDEAVIACAEEATYQLESQLIIPAVKEVPNPERMMEHLMSKADEMAPVMKFLAQVCSTQKYREQMEPALSRMCDRYEHYAEQLAKMIGCEVFKIKPYLYMCITSVTNYMIFGEKAYILPQLEFVMKSLMNEFNCKTTSPISKQLLKEESVVV